MVAFEVLRRPQDACRRCLQVGLFFAPFCSSPPPRVPAEDDGWRGGRSLLCDQRAMRVVVLPEYHALPSPGIRESGGFSSIKWVCFSIFQFRSFSSRSQPSWYLSAAI